MAGRPPLTVEGTLDAVGTSTSPITFTSTNDNTVGGPPGPGPRRPEIGPGSDSPAQWISSTPAVKYAGLGIGGIRRPPPPSMTTPLPTRAMGRFRSPLPRFSSRTMTASMRRWGWPVRSGRPEPSTAWIRPPSISIRSSGMPRRELGQGGAGKRHGDHLHLARRPDPADPQPTCASQRH
jgi:hypothetical protein